MTTSSNQPRLIKKYKNRRLYDLKISQYITVDDLARYVIEGLPFQVVDAASGKDMTSASLLQIFVEMEANSTQFLSPEMLRQLIILAHHPMNRSLKVMFEQMMTVMGKQLEHNPYLNELQQTTEMWGKQAQALLEQWKTLFQQR